MQLHCCELRSLVVNAFAFQPSHPRSIRTWVTNVWNVSKQSIDAVHRSGKRNARNNHFFASKPCITVRVEAAMPAIGIAIMWQQLFCLRKRCTATLYCGCLHKFWITSFSLLQLQEMVGGSSVQLFYFMTSSPLNPSHVKTEVKKKVEAAKRYTLNMKDVCMAASIVFMYNSE